MNSFEALNCKCECLVKRCWPKCCSCWLLWSNSIGMTVGSKKAES